MSRTTILVAFVALCIAGQALAASINERFHCDDLQIIQNPHKNGSIQVRRSIVHVEPTSTERDHKRFVNVGNFRAGSLTRRSMLFYISRTAMTSDDIAELNLTLESGDQNDVFTFVEGFDRSRNGSGGLVSVSDSNGLGSNSITLFVRAVAPNVPLNVTFVVYSENFKDGGSFRFGQYVENDVRLHEKIIMVPGIEAGIITARFDFERSNSTIGLIQGWDQNRENGTGGVAYMEGGVGSSHLTMYLDSGIGEDLHAKVTLYGRVVKN